MYAFRKPSKSSAEGPSVGLAGVVVVLAMAAGLCHSTSPLEPATLTVGRSVEGGGGLSTVNSADRKRKGVVGTFVRLAMVGSDMMGKIQGWKAGCSGGSSYSRRLSGYVRLYSARHVTFLTPPSGSGPGTAV